MTGNPIVSTRQGLGLVAFCFVFIALAGALKIVSLNINLQITPEIYWFLLKLICGVILFFVALFLIFKEAKELPADDENF
jgi:hypothetical protein